MIKYCTKFVLLVIAFFVLNLPASAQTTRLVTNANDAGPGSLRNAVSSAVPGDIIRIDGTSANFLHKGITTIVLTSGEINFSTDRLVFKGFYNAAGDTVKVSGNNVSRIFNTSAATMVTLDGMFLINGKGPSIGGNGGALNQSVGSVTISNSTFSGNTATALQFDYGLGGVFIHKETLPLLIPLSTETMLWLVEEPFAPTAIRR